MNSTAHMGCAFGALAMSKLADMEGRPIMSWLWLIASLVHLVISFTGTFWS